MDVAGFCRQANLVVVVGKGGVGKTTVTAALALCAAQAGLDVLLTSLGDSGSIPSLFGDDEPLGYDERELIALPGAGRVRGRVLTPDSALIEYLHDHGLGRISKRLVQTGALDVVATAIPGIREVLVLGKLKQLEQAGAADLLLLDAPATGHALRFLTSSGGLLDAARGGPLRSQAEQVVELLADPARSQVLLVAIPEETPVNETVEMAYQLEEEVGVALGPLVVNECYPDRPHLEGDPAAAAAAAGVAVDPEVLTRVTAAARIAANRLRLQRTQLERLAHDLPLAHLVLPHIFGDAVGLDGLEKLADALAGGIASLDG
jgi:anion-transporting  ArsA/GET3 family ATPase